MILENQKSSTLEVYGENTSKKATINASKIAKLQYMLTEGLYSDPLSAVIVEIVNNGMDAVIESGKDALKHPVIVEFKRHTLGYVMTIKDEGIGMSREFFENVFMSMLSSTKEDDNNVIGHFGIGGKSWASLGKQVKFTTVKDGRKCLFLCYKGEEFIDYDLLFEEDTTEENGVEFELPLSYSEYTSAINKAKQKLCYYDTVALIIDGKLWENKIYRTDGFQWCSNLPSQYLHLCLKDVIYLIDYSKLGINQIAVPIALRFGLDDGIVPTPSRENILMNKDTIEKIKAKIAEAAEWLVKKWNDSVIQANNIWDVWQNLNTQNKIVVLEGTSLDVSFIEKYTTLLPINPKVNGITQRDAGWYKRNSGLLNTFSAPIAEFNYRVWNTKRVWRELVDCLQYQKTVVFVSRMPVGNHKFYLKSLYTHRNAVFFLKRSPTLKLSWLKSNVLQGSMTDFKQKMIELKEVVRQLEEKCEFHLDIEEEAGYKTWLATKRAEMRLKRNLIGHKQNNSLNKQAGEVTIAWDRQHGANHSKRIFGKKTEKIESLYKIPGLIVYSLETNPKIEAFANLGWKIPTLKLAIIGKLEAKKLPKSKKIIKFEQFMKGEGGKLFGRICSALLFKKETEKYELMMENSKDLVQQLSPQLNAHYKIIEEYLKDTPVDGGVEKELEKELLYVAEKFGLYDKQVWDSYIFLKEHNDKYSFLSVFNYDEYSEESKGSFTKVVSEMLFYRKKYKGDLKNIDIQLLSRNAPAKIRTKNTIKFN